MMAMSATAAVAVLAVLFGPPAAAGSTFGARIRAHPKLLATVTQDRSERFWVKFPTRFRSLDSVCLSFVFQGHLLDLGDSLTIDNFGGFSVPAGGSSQSSRTLCTVYQNEQSLLQFLDGKQRLTITMESGSARIVSFAATAMGTPRHRAPSAAFMPAGRTALANSGTRHHRCTKGYWKPCLRPASDYDCARGGGNGPRYVYGIVHDNPRIDRRKYRLDADHDGIGCEKG
jgi:hypothetical protein